MTIFGAGIASKCAHRLTYGLKIRRLVMPYTCWDTIAQEWNASHLLV